MPWSAFKAIQILIGFFAVVLLDVIWFSFMGGVYDTALAPLQAEFNSDLTSNLLMATIVLYFLFSSAIVFFVMPKTVDLDYTQSFLWGGFLGLIVYGVFDLTNYVFLNKWPLRIAILDICWGFLLFGLITILLKFLQTFFKK